MSTSEMRLAEAVAEAGMLLWLAETVEEPSLRAKDRDALRWVRNNVLPQGLYLEPDCLSADGVLGILLAHHEVPAITRGCGQEGAYGFVWAAEQSLGRAVEALGLDPTGAFSPVMASNAYCGDDVPRLNQARRLVDRRSIASESRIG